MCHGSEILWPMAWSKTRKGEKMTHRVCVDIMTAKSCQKSHSLTPKMFHLTWVLFFFFKGNKIMAMCALVTHLVLSGEEFHFPMKQKKEVKSFSFLGLVAE